MFDGHLPKAKYYCKEIRLCRRTPEYFLDNYGHIYDATSREWVPFGLWLAQVQTLRSVADHRLVVILHARQVGVTWLVLGYALWLMLFRPAATVLLFSRRGDEAIDLLKTRLRGMYDRLPEWLKLRSIEVDNEREWRLSNGSRALAFPTTADASYPATLVIVDEAELVPDLGRLMRAIKPSIDGGGRMILLSRSDKTQAQSVFKRVYAGGREKKTGWLGLFMPWKARPDRDDNWYEAQKADILQRTGSLDELHEQYPASDVEAISPPTLDKRIAPEWLQECFVEAAPLSVAGVPQAPAIPGLAVYALPQPSHDYVIGADPAEGNAKSNDSALVVLDATTGEEVASLAGKIPPAELAAQANDIGKWYNNASVLVERNNHGHAVLLGLSERGDLRLLSGHDDKRGWLTSRRGKAVLYDRCTDAFHNREVVLHSFDTYAQLASIDGSTLRAPAGDHVDRADAFALACAGRANAGDRALVLRAQIALAEQVRIFEEERNSVLRCIADRPGKAQAEPSRGQGQRCNLYALPSVGEKRAFAQLPSVRFHGQDRVDRRRSDQVEWLSGCSPCDEYLTFRPEPIVRAKAGHRLSPAQGSQRRGSFHKSFQTGRQSPDRVAAPICPSMMQTRGGVDESRHGSEETRPSVVALEAEVIPQAVEVRNVNEAGLTLRDFEDLAIDVSSGRLCFCLGVQTRTSQEVVQVHDLALAAMDANPILEVHCIAQALVERSDFLGDSARPKGRRLADAAVLHHPLERVFGSVILAGHTILFVDVMGFAVNEIAFWLTAEVIDHLRNCVGQEHVVGIQVRSNLALGVAETFVDRLALALVGLGHPRDSAAVGFQDIDRFILGASVDDAILDARIGLIQNAVDAPPEKSTLIVRRSDNGNERPGFCPHQREKRADALPCSCGDSLEGRIQVFGRLFPTEDLEPFLASSHKLLAQLLVLGNPGHELTHGCHIGRIRRQNRILADLGQARGVTANNGQAGSEGFQQRHAKAFVERKVNEGASLPEQRTQQRRPDETKMTDWQRRKLTLEFGPTFRMAREYKRNPTAGRGKKLPKRLKHAAVVLVRPEIRRIKEKILFGYERQLRGSERCLFPSVVAAIQSRRDQEDISAARELLFQERGPRELGDRANGACRGKRTAERGATGREDLGFEELWKVGVLNVRNQVDLPLCREGQVRQMRIRSEQNVELAKICIMIDLSQISPEVERFESHVVGTMLKKRAVEDRAVNRVVVFWMISKQSLKQPLQQKGYSAGATERNPAQFNAYPHSLSHSTQLFSSIVGALTRLRSPPFGTADPPWLIRPGFVCLRNFRYLHLRR
jgi:hypothetical protein